MDNSLESIERGLAIIDTLIKNGIMIWVSDGTIKYKAKEGTDPGHLDVLLKILKAGKSGVIEILTQPEAAHKTLQDRQRTLSTAFNDVVVLEENLMRLSEIVKRRSNGK